MEVATPSDSWNPAVYERFAAERAQPFFDLLDLCTPVAHGRAIDLGCGTGELTAEFHLRLGLLDTAGVDTSQAMLAKAGGRREPGLSFGERDIGGFGTAADDAAAYDIVLSNAALQWVPADHRDVLRGWRRALRPDGQLAVQVPANSDHASHVVAVETASEEPFLSALGGAPPPDPVRGVLAPEEYAELFYELGFAQQHVRLQVYGHVLPSTAAVVEWVSGTSLTRFRSRLAPELYEEFVRVYTERLLRVLGEREPYFYAFKRILMWGRLG